MKRWISLLLTLALIGATQTSSQRLLDVDGSSPNGQMVSWRNPWFGSGILGPGCSSQFLVLITNPLNGSAGDMYFPVISTNVTVTVQGATSPQCYYKTVGGSWNTFTHCGVGVNGTYEDVVTMPEGYPQTLTVNITTDCGTMLNTSSFTVWYNHGSPYNNKGSIVISLGVGMVVFTMLMTVLRRKRQTV